MIQKSRTSRIEARLACEFVVFLLCIGKFAGIALGQSASPIESPLFRPRTDPMALQDADAVRERLKSISDSRGPINPLGDYVKPKGNAEPKAKVDRESDRIDEEAHRIPTLDAEAQQRLKSQPPSVAPDERHIIGLYPAPQITSNTGETVLSSWQDDGFRPLASMPVSATDRGTVIRTNYQIGDPAAMIPPTLGVPSGNIPNYLAPPSGGFGVMPGTVPFVGAPGSNVIPAPPSYIVPGPGNPMNVPTTPTPYAAPAPTYSRSGGTVNSLPFVSAPPQARDARWMVSPEVYRRMEGAACANTPSPAYGAPAAGTGVGSPFFYAPPTAMPMPTPRTASRHSWLHPFRH
jgi:hypothetical protein